MLCLPHYIVLRCVQSRSKAYVLLLLFQCYSSLGLGAAGRKRSVQNLDAMSLHSVTEGSKLCSLSFNPYVQWHRSGPNRSLKKTLPAIAAYARTVESLQAVIGRNKVSPFNVMESLRMVYTSLWSGLTADYGGEQREIFATFSPFNSLGTKIYFLQSHVRRGREE